MRAPRPHKTAFQPRGPFAFLKLLGGIGHMAKQLSFQNTNWRHRYSFGGSLRQQRAGRGARPLSGKEPIHLVFKANKEVIRGGFRLHHRFALIHHLLQKYQAKFFIKIEQVSIQSDHIHLLIRTSRRSLYQSFFRVLAGQIAQRFEKEGLLSVAGTKVVSSATKSKAAARATSVTDTLSMDQKVGGEWSVTGTAAGFGLKAILQTTQRVSSDKEAISRSQATSGLRRLWKHRPFTRVVKGDRAYQTVRDYIQLNEREALGDIPYRSLRLKGLSSADWEVLWS